MPREVYTWSSGQGVTSIVAPKYLLAILLVILVVLPLALLAAPSATSDCIVVQSYREEASTLTIRVRNECYRRIHLESIVYERNGHVYRESLGVTLEPGETRSFTLSTPGGGAAPTTLMLIYEFRGVQQTSVYKITR